MNINFDIAKIARAINTHGQEFVFLRHGEDDYGQPIEQTSQITIKGLFHQTRSYITKNITDGTIARSKPSPQILTLFNNTSMIELKDELDFCGKRYTVTGVDNIGNLGIALDISLELIDDGT